MAIGIYAGSTASGMVLLPSPTDIDTSMEQIWSEDTGRAQSGTNKAKMIGDSVAEKQTHNIKWGVLTQAQLNLITSKLTAGFFYFGMGLTASVAQSSAEKYYRSEITYKVIQVADKTASGGIVTMYKDVATSVIQQ